MTDLPTFIAGDLDSWISGLPRYQRGLIQQLSGNGLPVAEIPRVWLEAGSHADTAPFAGQRGAKVFYDKFLDELHDLLCSPNAYQQERAEIVGALKGGKPGTVAVTATILANTLPASTSYLQPIVAVALYTVGSMGLSAWCKMQTERRAAGNGGSEGP